MFRKFAIGTTAVTVLVLGVSTLGESRRTVAADVAPGESGPVATSPQQLSRVKANGSLDRTGSRRVGTASFYADRYVGRKMADGTRMRRNGDNAASLSLPLGTIAKVTNLETGKSDVVTIRDRGPYVKDKHRIIDLSPGTAQRIGISKRQGLAKVAVAPIAVPLADGRMIPGAGAQEERQSIHQARLNEGSGATVRYE